MNIHFGSAALLTNAAGYLAVNRYERTVITITDAVQTDISGIVFFVLNVKIHLRFAVFKIDIVLAEAEIRS